MIRKLAWLALIAGFMALVVHAATSDTGLVGWLNALQQRWAGAYSRKLSFFVLMVCGMLLAWLVMLGLVWAAAAASALWSHWQQSSDARATYTPLTLARVTGSLPSSATHLALHGRLLWGHSVQRRQKSGDRIDYHLVPIVARDWHAGAGGGLGGRADVGRARHHHRHRLRRHAGGVDAAPRGIVMAIFRAGWPPCAICGQPIADVAGARGLPAFKAIAFLALRVGMTTAVPTQLASGSV